MSDTAQLLVAVSIIKREKEKKKAYYRTQTTYMVVWAAFDMARRSGGVGG